MNNLEKKLSELPKSPGVYFHKNKSGEIIYVGKAANLRNRVRQYFHKSRVRDPKTDALVAEIVDVDWLVLETELDALFVEAEMIRRYMPRYNILLRDDKSFIYVRIDIKSAYPSLTFTRRPLDDGAEYIGPFISKYTINRALKYLRRVFPYSTHTPTNIPKRACLQAQIGLCPGLEAGLTSLVDYRKNLRQLIGYVTGKRKKVITDMQKEMNLAAKAKNYEQAAQLRNRIFALRKLDNQIIFGDRESIDLSKDRGLIELSELLKIKPPRRIEGFDISHMQGTDTVASMVVFVAGVPDKSQYRKFKSRIKGNDDFIHMRETMSRRFSEKNIKLWGKPDLILIDGGKGQVSSALSTLQHIGIYIPLIGLAKRYEEIIIPRASDALESVEASPVGENKFAKDLQINSDVTTPEIDNDKIKQFAKKLQFETVHLPSSSDALKLLQRIRDESHRFAISYHSTLKRGRQTVSALDSVPSIGAIYKKKLIKEFGSVAGVRSATQDELALVVGPWRARLVKQFIG